MMFFYRILWLMLTPLWPLYMKRRIARGKEDLQRVAERYGKKLAPRPDGFLVWIHAASVGEMQSVLPLITRLHAVDSRLNILLTTGTVTSAQLVIGKKIPRVLHQYVPLDHPLFVRRFLQHSSPDLALWVESEFWPELLHQTHARTIPMVLINARMSEKSARKWKCFPKTIARLLGYFSAIVASSDADGSRLKALGAPNIHATSNLKYDAPALAYDAHAHTQLTQQIGARACLLAASTHEGEEALLAQALRDLLVRTPDLLMVIVPRHASRGEAVAALLRAQGFQVAQRSAQQPIMPETQLYIADTMGELGLFFAAIKRVIMGGSLVPHGGHNLLEPARATCAIITGTHMHHFSEMTQRMLHADAVLQVSGASSLFQACTRLLSEPALVDDLGARAHLFASQSQGACDAVMELVQRYMPRGNAHA